MHYLLQNFQSISSVPIVTKLNLEKIPIMSWSLDIYEYFSTGITVASKSIMNKVINFNVLYRFKALGGGIKDFFTFFVR